MTSLRQLAWGVVAGLLFAALAALALVVEGGRRIRNRIMPGRRKDHG